MPSGISVGDCGEERKGSEAWEARKESRLWGGPCWVAHRSKGNVRLPSKGSRKQLRVVDRASHQGACWTGLQTPAKLRRDEPQ